MLQHSLNSNVTAKSRFWKATLMLIRCSKLHNVVVLDPVSTMEHAMGSVSQDAISIENHQRLEPHLRHPAATTRLLAPNVIVKATRTLKISFAIALRAITDFLQNSIKSKESRGCKFKGCLISVGSYSPRKMSRTERVPTCIPSKGWAGELGQTRIAVRDGTYAARESVFSGSGLQTRYATEIWCSILRH